jgi:hypothetical protein
MRKRLKPDKALDVHLRQASWSLPGLMICGNMLPNIWNVTTGRNVTIDAW